MSSDLLLDEPIRPGTVLGEQYRLEKALGRGAGSTVFLAEDMSLHRLVAVKVMGQGSDSSPASIARFDQEARLLASIEHPNIVPIFSAGRHQGRPYLVMKFLEGRTLADEQLAIGALSMARVKAVLEPLTAALEFLHHQGLVHRDVKPANVFHTTKGEVLLMDFGLVRTAHSTLTKTGARLGTPRYMAPEQLRDSKKVDARADVYALAMVALELFTGQSGNAATLEQLPLDVPDHVRPALEAALSADPAARPASATAFFNSLFAPSSTSLSTAEAATVVGSVKSRLVSAWLVLAAVGLVMLAAAVTWLFARAA